MTSKGFVRLLICFISLHGYGQIVSGRVVDAATKEPIVTASVYFDNTTIGTTTDENGDFTIEYSDVVQSTLVISFLGYEKVYISDYREKQTLNIALTQAPDVLDEVVVSYDDELTRKQKLKLFKSEFLGMTKLGRSCKILNEADIVLRYNGNDKVLYVFSTNPIIIYNKALAYEVRYDLTDFELRFRYLNPKTDRYTLKSGHFFGTMFFKDLNAADQKRSIIRKREKAFGGSVQHFLRALYNEDLKSQDYTVFRRGFKVKESDIFKVEPVENSKQKKVKLSERISILYDKKLQSDMYLAEGYEEFFIDVYGNFSPILGVYFTGYMNQLRVGDMLPLDYEIGD